MAAFAAEPIFYIRNFPITNTILSTILVDTIIISTVISVKKNLSKIPGNLQNAIEAIIELFYNLTDSIAGKRASIIFPFFMSFFIFILIANWSSLIPGFGTIGFFEEDGKEKFFIPLLRGATTDINTTLALALISAIATHILSLKILGIKEYVSRYFSFNPINLFIGMLEIIGEFTKIISLSFRLFGNLFAGEVVLFSVSSIFAFLFPLPFLMLEIIVGFVQALVFSMLTMTFMAILTTPHHQTEEVIQA